MLHAKLSRKHPVELNRDQSARAGCEQVREHSLARANFENRAAGDRPQGRHNPLGRAGVGQKVLSQLRTSHGRALVLRRTAPPGVDPLSSCHIDSPFASFRPSGTERLRSTEFASSPSRAKVVCACLGLKPIARQRS
jgi:hypothetical protein